MNQQNGTATDWGDLSLMGLFQIEVETQVDALNQNLLNLEKSGWRDASSLECLMRAAHSIKGAARIVQVEAAVKVSHVLEDCFIAAQQGILTLTPNHVDVLLTGVDLLARLGAIEESTLAEQLPAYDADTDAVVLAIEALVTAAERGAQSTTPDSAPEIAFQTAPETAENTSSETAANIALDNFLSSYSQPQTATDYEPGLLYEPIQADSFDDASTQELDWQNTGGMEPPASSEASADESSRMIRISAENLKRLMGLAGESLVESNWLQPFSQSLLQLKRQQQAVIAMLEKQQNLSQADREASGGIDQAVQGMQLCHTLLGDQLSDLDLFSRRFGQLSDRLYREVIASHMCAFSEGTRGYSRLVRDLSRQLGKQVSLEIVGLNTQVDRDILTRLETPITHLLTNAVVHGIEMPDVRMAMGKPAEGKICLRAIHRSGMLVVSVEDDGAGVSYIALRQKIAEKGLVTADVADRLSESELSEFLFLPGFSTAAQVDKIAGRGYGLDLVRTMAQSVGGSLQAVSPAVEEAMTGLASGTRFQFQLPLTLSVVRSLLFEVAGEPYAISLSRIARVVKLRREQIGYSENRPYFNLSASGSNPLASTDSDKTHREDNRLETENISLVSAQQILALPSSSEPADLLSVIVIGEAGNRYGVCVDSLSAEQDLVVRSLDPRLGKVPNISAAALTEKGAPILIVDVADMLRSAERLAVGSAASSALTGSMPASARLSPAVNTSGAAGSFSQFETPATPAPKRVLVVDDSMTVRAMEKKLLQNRGYEVDIAVDGAEGWNSVRMNEYDLVITDVDMPRMSGIELIAKMRAHEATKRLPVIVVSYKDRAEDQLAGLNAGANYYLTKSSFHDDGLINAVIDLIG